MKRIASVLITAGFALSSFRITGQPVATPASDDFQVNNYTPRNQLFPTVAASAAGNFVVVWDSFGSGDTTDPDVSAKSIQMRCFDFRGKPIGEEFQVNTYTTSLQRRPSAAVDGIGNSIVVWDSQGSGDGKDTSDKSIQLRRFDFRGMPLGNKFLVDVTVNTETSGNQQLPVVSADADGDFVVVWESADSGAEINVKAQLFDSSGDTRGGEFQINASTTRDQLRPSVGVDGDGDFVVVWQETVSVTEVNVKAQRFNSSGTPQSSEFQVNAATPGIQRRPSVAIDANGGFVVVWENSDTLSAPVTIKARRFDSNGQALNSEFQINDASSEDQTNPTVTTDLDGGFAIVWNNRGADANIQMSQFDSSDIRIGSQQRVNSFTPRSQARPSIGVEADGDFVIVWQSLGSSGYGSNDPDTAAHSIQRQLVGSNADLVITNSNGLSSAFPGQAVTYTLTVTNAGPDDILGTIVRSNFSKELVDVTWTCSSSPGSACSSGSVAGNVFDSVDLLVGGTLTYTANARVADSAAGSISNTASVSPPAGDDDLDNNLLVDRDPMVFERVTTDVLVDSNGLGPEVAFDTARGILTVWERAGPPGGAEGVYALFDPEPATPMGGPQTLFQGQLIAPGGRDPAVAYDVSSDEFLVVWQTGDMGLGDIRGRRLKQGVPVGPELVIGVALAGERQLGPAVAFDPETRQFLVVWWQSPSGADIHGIRGRLVSTQPVDEEFQINFTPSQQEPQPGPRIAFDHATRDFFVVWPAQLSGVSSIRARRVDAVPMNNEFQVSITGLDLRKTPDVVSIPSASSLLVVWTQEGAAGGVLGRLIRNGIPMDAEFLIHQGTTPENPRASSLNDHVMVVWEDDLSGNREIFGHPLDRHGALTGTVFQINGTQSAVDSLPTIATAPPGIDAVEEFVVVWESEPLAGEKEIRRRVFTFDADVFRDGFEDGNLSSWSLTTP